VVPSSNGSYFATLEDFVGEKINVPFPDNTAFAEEKAQKRKEWLPNFLLHGGVSKLLALLQSLSTLTQNEGKMSENTKRISKKCLCEVMQCVKILLSCSFCASSADQDLALTLQRKLSTHSQGESQIKDTASQFESPEPTDPARKSAMSGREATKNKLQEEQESTLEEMEPLIELMKNRVDLEVSNHLAEGLDAFQQQLLGVIVDSINRRDSKIEDTEIVNQGLSIWMSCLASEPSILNELYKERGCEN
jgi:hypothetical protein